MKGWDASLLLVAMICVGLGAVASTVVHLRVVDGWSQLLALALLWLGLATAIAFAFARGVPPGLFVIRPTDVLWGVGAGLLLRWLQGVIGSAGSSSFPGLVGTNSSIPSGWWWSDFLTAGVLGPVFEELFFRFVLLVLVYQLLRRALGGAGAGVTALLVSAGSFVLIHGLGGFVYLADGLQLFAVGSLCATIVLLTGRIWGALFAHISYNVSYLALVIIGTMFS